MPQRTTAINKQQENAPLAKPTITVFIHGSRFFGSLDDRFHCPPGLHQVDSLPENFYYHKLANALQAVDPVKYPSKNFYAYGWSGYISFKARKKSGENLYKALERLTKNYERRYFQRPEIRLICHSHGGNVALNLVHAKNHVMPLTIAETVLMACPVQRETCELIVDPMFEKVYSLYSITDLAQILDAQGLYKTPLNPRRHVEFSGKRFQESSNFVQAAIKINHRAPGHYDFRLERFFRLLPTTLHAMDQLKIDLGHDIANHELVVELIKQPAKKQCPKKCKRS